MLLAAAALAAAVLFEDVTERAGIRFVLENAGSPQKHQIETMVGGVAVLDYDGDGHPDLYFVNGAAQPSLEKTDSSYWNRLYRNAGGGRFEDVTEKAGVAGRGFGIGAAAADFDNDGHTDLYVTGVNHNTLFRNRGDGTFKDVTERAGVSARRRDGSKPWSIAAAWFDYDNDGWLDLLVVHYVHWDPAKEPYCGEPGVYRTYCHPKYYDGLPNTLYRNNRDGTFTDVSEASGIGSHTGKGMGVAVADYDRDGRPDVFIANDTVPNFLFRNEGNGRFRETAAQAGVAYNDDGRALSSMGVDFRDVDNDGLDDVFVTALANETFPLYRNLGKGLFVDITYPSRVGAATLPLAGWGNGIYDFDNDGLKDLFAANADVQDNTEVYSSRKSRLPALLLRNAGKTRFEPHSVGEPALHRGAAFADFDRDGRVDVVVTRIRNLPLLLRNQMGGGNHWLRLRLTGRASNRAAIGASVRIVSASGKEQWNHVTTSVGYASSSERAVHFGLGQEGQVKVVEIRWPSGVVQRLEKMEADRYLDVREP